MLCVNVHHLTATKKIKGNKRLNRGGCSAISTNYQPESLRVIIPVGGMAKRLRPLTAEVSKACVRLLNRPLIEISLLTLARQQIKNFIFGVKGYTNYKSLHDHTSQMLSIMAAPTPRESIWNTIM